MTDDEFALGIDAILLSDIRGHAAHRALDLWWTRYAMEKGGPIADATKKWMAAIEGNHRDNAPYPLGAARWWAFWRRRPKAVCHAADQDDGWIMSCP